MRSQLLGVGDLGVKLIGSGGGGSIKRDNFNRANGALGANWTVGVDASGVPTISSNAVIGVAAQLGNYRRTGEAYGNDHFSEITVPGTLAVNNFVGVAVRLQSDGSTCYAAIYFHNPAGRYLLQIYRRAAGGGAYTLLNTDAVGGADGGGYTLPGPLNAGDRLRLSVAGSALTLTLNGVRVSKITDTTIPTGGSPGVICFGTDPLDNWAGDNCVAEPAAPTQVFTSSPPNSANNGGGHHITVLSPASVQPGHNFLYLLDVQPDGDFTYGNPMDTLYGLNAHNQYNLTIVLATFAIGSWFIDPENPGTHPDYKHETFMVSDLVPWVTANYATSHTEKHWLMGFSRGGWGGHQLLLRHPTVFDRGAFWDFPFDEDGATLNSEGLDANYGSTTYLNSTYQITSAYLDTFKVPFQSRTRIWIGGHEAFATRVANAHSTYTTKGILHAQQTDLVRSHRWDSGWVSDGLAALAAMT